MLYVSLLPEEGRTFCAYVYILVFFCKAANWPKDTGKGWQTSKYINQKNIGVKKEHSMEKRRENNAAFKCNLKILEASRLDGDRSDISSESC